MKLSEAIRLGSMLRPQCVEVLFSVDGRSCALGAALEAVGLKDRIYGALVRDALPLLMIQVNHPLGMPIPAGTFTGAVPEGISRIVENSVWGVIVSLNNYCGWTRERIADWVETIEREQEVAQQKEKELVGAA